MRPETTWGRPERWWQAVCRRTRLAGEAGMATAEYVAILALVASLVLVVAPADLARPITDSVQAAFCLLSGSECTTESASSSTNEDFMPATCNRSTQTYKGEVGVSIAFFDAKEGVSFARTERSDGKTSFTIVDTAGMGATAEVGAEAEFGTAKVGITAEARAGLEARIGDTWVVDTDKADDVQTRLMGGQAIEKSLVGKIPGVGDDISDWAADRIWGDLGDPQITFVAAGMNANANANANLKVFDEQVAGASVEVGAAVLLGTEYDKSAEKSSDHTRTTYIQGDLSTTGGVSWVAGGFEGKLESTTIIKAKYDADDELVQIELVSSVSAQDLGMVGSNLPNAKTLLKGSTKGMVVETTTIPLETAEERATGSDWIGSLGTDPTDLSKLAQEKGKVSLMTYSTDDLTLALGGKVAAGVKLGGRAEIGVADQQVRDAFYLGAPSASGQRDLVPFESCTGG